MCSRPYDKTSQGTRIQFNLYRQLSEYQANKKNTNVVSYPLGKLIATANTAKWKSEQHASGLWIEYRQLVRAGSRKAFQNHLDHGLLDRWAQYEMSMGDCSLIDREQGTRCQIT